STSSPATRRRPTCCAAPRRARPRTRRRTTAPAAPRPLPPADRAERRPVNDVPAGPGGDRVFVLGAGRAGRGLTRALRAAGVSVVGFHGRRADAAGADVVSAGAMPAALGEANVVLVAVQDAALDSALDEL